MDNDPERVLEAWFVAYRSWRYLDDEVKPLLMDRDAAARRLREATLAVVSAIHRHKLPVRPIGGPASSTAPSPLSLPVA